jgi:hypothetical protein
MTVIAWDGRTLAADKQTTAGGRPRVTTKVYRVPEGLVAMCGSSVASVAVLEWFQKGRPPNDYPAIQKTDKDCGAMFVDWTGQLWIYEDHPHAIRIENRFDAMGSGRDYAIAALHLGHDARTAVKVACELDVSCGQGIDSFDLFEARQHKDFPCT